MTKEELKFALAVESFINTVPTPEYRQLLVEATTVLGALVSHDEEARICLNCIVSLDDLVANANRIFLEDQVSPTPQSSRDFKWPPPDRIFSIHPRLPTARTQSSAVPIRFCAPPRAWPPPVVMRRFALLPPNRTPPGVTRWVTPVLRHHHRLCWRRW